MQSGYWMIGIVLIVLPLSMKLSMNTSGKIWKESAKMTLKQGLYLHRRKPRQFQSLVYDDYLFKRLDNDGTGQVLGTMPGFEDGWIRVVDLPLGTWDEDTPDMP